MSNDILDVFGRPINKDSLVYIYSCVKNGSSILRKNNIHPMLIVDQRPSPAPFNKAGYDYFGNKYKIGDYFFGAADGIYQLLDFDDSPLYGKFGIAQYFSKNENPSREKFRIDILSRMVIVDSYLAMQFVLSARMC